MTTDELRQRVEQMLNRLRLPEIGLDSSRNDASQLIRELKEREDKLVVQLSKEAEQYINWRGSIEYELKVCKKAFMQIASGEISGEPYNYKDALSICKNIAKDSLKKLGIQP